MASIRKALFLVCAALVLIIGDSTIAEAQTVGSFSNQANCTIQVGATTNAGTRLGPTALRFGQTWTFTVPAGERLAKVFVNDAVEPADFTPSCVNISITTFCQVTTYFLCRSGINYTIY